MQNLETYAPEFDKTIEILNQILNDLDGARYRFKEEGEQFTLEYTNKNGSTNLVKNPIYVTISELNDKALKYLNELGLTPAGLKKIKDKKAAGNSKLDKILGEMYV